MLRHIFREDSLVRDRISLFIDLYREGSFSAPLHLETLSLLKCLINHSLYAVWCAFSAGMLPKVMLLLSFLFTVGGLGALGAGPSEATTITLLDADCSQHKKCNPCIQTLGCWWCKDKSWSLESPRCFSNVTRGDGCAAADIVNPQGTLKEIHDGAEVKENNKIHPQVVELKLRKGEKMNISIQYTDEKNRPLDLYIIMDLSCSMKKHKDKVANASEALARNLRMNLTSNLRIGFGSFVDKPLAPFGFVVPKDSSIGECDGKAVEVFPYGFKNHLKLTDDIPHFVEEVKSAGISHNIDSPEGTLDGLLQSIVCTEEIGWRKKKGNRKLVVISTDGPFHMAGDGKLVGVELPHNGACFMDQSGMYTHATILDYPSISLLRQRIRENDVFVIFAVTKHQESLYKQLSQQFHPYAVTQSIDNDNSITTVIENEYKKLVNTVTLLSDNKYRDYISTDFFVRCPGKSDFISGNQCNGVGAGMNVSFKVEVELKDCPSKSALWKSDITVYPQSSSDDYLTVHLAMLCGCDCEPEHPLLPANKPEKVVNCSGNGNYRCGICECDAKKGGPFCNCTLDENGLIDTNQCLDPASTSDRVCNERGVCDSCGQCKCNLKDGKVNAFKGRYCECDNTDCPRENSDDGLCNKKKGHGHCECTKAKADGVKTLSPRCICEPGYEGLRCQCPSSNETCLDRSSDKICNDIGTCKCGKCSCGPSYKGDFCEIQHAKVNGSCERARRESGKCVKCLVSSNSGGETNDGKRERCTNESRVSVEEQEHVCEDSVEDLKGCRVDFIIREWNIFDGRIKLEIESDEDVLREKCPVPAPFFEILIGIVSGMVLLGILMLLSWKVVTHVQDRKEYERFETFVKATPWNTQDNPLYQSSTSQFKNPAYVDYQESEIN